MTLSPLQPVVVSPASAAAPPPLASPSPTPPSPDGATTTPRWRDRVHPAGPRCVFCFYLGARGRRAGAQGLHPGPRRGRASAARNMATSLRGRIASCPLPPPGGYGSSYGSCADRWPLPAATALGSRPASAASASLIFISAQAWYSQRSTLSLSSSRSTPSRFVSPSSQSGSGVQSRWGCCGLLDLVRF